MKKNFREYRYSPDHPGLLAHLSEIDEFKGAGRALRRLATVESIGSSTRIEGSKLTDWEVEQLLALLEIKSFASRDEQEVAGYAEVVETIFQAWTDIPIPGTLSGSYIATCCATARRMSLTGASRNTLKEHFRDLVEKNLILQHGGGRSTWYSLP